MATMAEILAADALLRSATVRTEELAPGDRVVFRRADPGAVVCTIVTTGTVVSAVNLSPTQIHPIPWWRVVVTQDDGETHTCSTSAHFTWWRVAPVVAPVKTVPGPKARCPECGRVFDLTNEADADEFYNGHDCEE